MSTQFSVFRFHGTPCVVFVVVVNSTGTTLLFDWCFCDHGNSASMYDRMQEVNYPTNGSSMIAPTDVTPTTRARKAARQCVEEVLFIEL